MMSGATIPDIDITPREWEIVRDILRAHVPHFEVYAFGSRAKRTAKPYSDLDIVVMTHAPLAIDITAAMAEAFSESDLPWKVDVVDWAAISDEFRVAILPARVLVQDHHGTLHT